MNLALHMKQVGEEFPDRPAIAQGISVLFRYGELADRVSRLACSMRRRFKLKPGDRVALILRNCPEYLEILYACWHAGLVAVPINAKLHSKEFAYILENSAASLLFAAVDLADTIATQAAPGSTAIIPVAGDEYTKLFTSDPMPPVNCAPLDPAWLFYTSGTTGKPKGAVLSHHNLLAMSQCYFADVDQQSPWSAILHAAPMSHGSGLYALPHVMQASCHVIPESGGFDPEEIYRLIQGWPAAVFFAAPTMVKRLLDHPADMNTNNLKTIIYGGGPMYLQLCLAGLERFGPKLAQLYGQGESPMTITALSASVHAEKDHPRWHARLASVGVPQSAVAVRIAGSEDRWLLPGETGEVCVRGETVMSGYWGNPEASAEALRGGWLHTGDVGSFDAEGFLTLKDRAKDLIISGGANIYPREVEETLLGHPDVAEVSIIGRADDEWGEIVIAYIVPKSGRVMDPATLDSYCLEHMARFKRPRCYRSVEGLPKNNYGKVLKTKLRELEQAQEI